MYFSYLYFNYFTTLSVGGYKLCKAPVKLSPPSNQHPAFYRSVPPVTQPTVSKH